MSNTNNTVTMKRNNNNITNNTTTSTNTLTTITLTQQEIWNATKPLIQKNKKKYTRKTKHNKQQD